MQATKGSAQAPLQCSLLESPGEMHTPTESLCVPPGESLSPSGTPASWTVASWPLLHPGQYKEAVPPGSPQARESVSPYTSWGSFCWVGNHVSLSVGDHQIVLKLRKSLCTPSLTWRSLLPFRCPNWHQLFCPIERTLMTSHDALGLLRGLVSSYFLMLLFLNALPTPKHLTPAFLLHYPGTRLLQDALRVPDGPGQGPPAGSG